MKVKDCVRMALSKSGRKNIELSNALGLAKYQSLNNKFVRNSWTAQDMIKVAKLTGGELRIDYPDGQSILIIDEEENS